MNRVKKQHYVPRCYLKQFTINKTKQIHVYDKELSKARRNNIIDVSSENYFYDFEYSEDLRKIIFMDLLKEEVSMEVFKEDQYIENYLAKKIENKLAVILNQLIDKSNEAISDTRSEKPFISRKAKKELAYCLAIQHIRTKSVRNNILNTLDCFNQLFENTEMSGNLYNNFDMPNEVVNYTHSKMLLDKDHIEKTANIFNQYIWIMGINVTKELLYTSDNPIGTIAHQHHDILFMSGLASDGVEVYLPLSPKVILLMFENKYHNKLKVLDSKYIYINDKENIRYYNSISAINSDRCVYSADGYFGLIEEMINNNPNVFRQPKLELNHAGKTYHSKR